MSGPLSSVLCHSGSATAAAAVCLGALTDGPLPGAAAVLALVEVLGQAGSYALSVTDGCGDIAKQVDVRLGATAASATRVCGGSYPVK